VKNIALKWGLKLSKMAKKLLQGDEAIASAARHAGMNFFGGYPITPASEILHYIVQKEDVKVVQFEDEIASINACIGASMAGAKAMTATSGPGFSLMQEGIGYAHMTKTPVVIVNVMRVGPSTGMPTMPSQGDILQCKYGSHGDYFPIVFYPNSVSEIYKVTFDAFNAAEEMEGPVILLSDGYLGHLYETFDMPEFKVAERKRKPIGFDSRHFTGLLSEDEVPKTQDAELYKKLMIDMKKRQEDAAKKYNSYEYIDNKSDTLLISYGSVSRLMYKYKDKYSYFRPIRIFPMIEDLKKIAKDYKKIIIVEMNTGQYKLEVEALLKREVNFIPILGGKINIKEVENELQKIH
jgi:2-oxoglutarate ferredoxin oxidoreductase subunit alpha